MGLKIKQILMGRGPLSLGLAILILFVLALSFYVRYKNENLKPDDKTTTTTTTDSKDKNSKGDNSKDDLENETPPENPPDATISPGESAKVQCGKGRSGTRPVFPRGGFAGNIGRSDQTEIEVSVQTDKGEVVGGLVEWRLYDWGELEIYGCEAIFIAPDSIGTAYSVSATINARIIPETSEPNTSSSGEGGPIFAGFVATTKVTILSGAAPGCYDPAGVAISINSVPTTSNVQIFVDTPRFLGRQYNGRVATVRDGTGDYYVQIYVNGALYGQTNSTVGDCEMATVKF
ncbi:MAG: hypothetical protein A2134_01170 [Candidatus Woykebacteria bacterium RBG_16_39_9b]|uniref:Uncharacterized protein n=1 Tax=Candidatus Woykebacteria bacterium RBG_16_39_9b TaxID=1802595 RepID=A0A1G1WBD1_9BACT|nr:MAG: hypothetical protein A2134_01170 [Candidatus Woykebacteria bacterium RBG_16_39_9b]